MDISYLSTGDQGQERLRHMDKPGDRSADDLDHERLNAKNAASKLMSPDEAATSTRLRSHYKLQRITLDMAWSG